MAITQGICNSFKQQLLGGLQDLDTDTLRIALYDASTASLDKTTTAYTATGEVSGAGYTARGQALTVQGSITLDGDTALIDFQDVDWPSSTISADGALIFNETRADAAVLVLAFGSTVSSTNGTFTVQFPTADASNAIIRIS